MTMNSPRDFEDTHPSDPADWFEADVDADDEFETMPWDEED